MMAEKTIAIHYTGSHPAGQYLPDVPPRDLSEKEAAACGYSVEDLVETGFYALAADPNVETAKPKEKKNAKA